MRSTIQRYLSRFNLDIRVTGNARFMDQKVTPDVLSFIAECISNLIASNLNRTFTTNDVWSAPYFIANSQLVFNKPSPQDLAAQHEYDKFISQPLKALSYARILSETRRGKNLYYQVVAHDILNYISNDPRSAYNFLCEYVTKVLEDSGFYTHILSFESRYLNNILTPSDFDALKKRFQRFIIGNTPITGKVEVNRIFPKVFNAIATDKIMPGTMRGHLTKHCFYYSDLMYNRPNWRDTTKHKQLTRQEAARLQGVIRSSQYRVNRAKNFIRNKYTQSELQTNGVMDPPTRFTIYSRFTHSQYLQITLRI